MSVDVRTRDAVLSDCTRYRYRLTRTWDSPRSGRCVFLMLNPSTADAHVEDPTIRKCMAFAHGWGFDAIDVVNLFAWRSTAPEGLLEAEDPVGLDNDAWIERVLVGAERIVAAWGRHASIETLLSRRVFVVKRLLEPFRAQVVTLGRNGDGSPKHPLYLSLATPVGV